MGVGYVGLMAYATMGALGWRWYTALCALPALLLVGACPPGGDGVSNARDHSWGGRRRAVGRAGVSAPPRGPGADGTRVGDTAGARTHACARADPAFLHSDAPRAQRVGAVNGRPLPAGAFLAPLPGARAMAMAPAAGAAGSARARVAATIAAVRGVFADRALARTALLLCAAWFSLSFGELLSCGASEALGRLSALTPRTRTYTRAGYGGFTVWLPVFMGAHGLRGDDVYGAV